MIDLSRRGFLGGLGAGLIAAPAIVRAASLMPVRAIIEPAALLLPAEPTAHWVPVNVVLKSRQQGVSALTSAYTEYLRDNPTVNPAVIQNLGVLFGMKATPRTIFDLQKILRDA
jgi:hypothetical protein